jgi:hypothetical protein
MTTTSLAFKALKPYTFHKINSFKKINLAKHAAVSSVIHLKR